MSERPLGVVFQTADGGTHEMWVPPGFAFVVTNGGILVANEKHVVTTLLSVRPMGGESDATEVHEHEGDAEDRVDERGEDSVGVVHGAEGGDGPGTGEGAAEGAGLPGGADRRSSACPYECDCHGDPFGDDLCEDCRVGSCSPWPEYRTPGPDDAPGITA